MPSYTRNLRLRLHRPRITDAATALVLLVALAAGGAACRARTLPDLGPVPSFALTERSGQPLTAADLSGRVWVVNFIFTRCPDVCPALGARMKQLQDQVGTGTDAVRLVSISVDPDHDTPAVLAGYADRLGAQQDWLFATGPRADVVQLVSKGFRLAYGDGGPPDAPITHSDRFVLVDRALRIRGYYHGSDADEVARLARDAAALRDGSVS